MIAGLEVTFSIVVKGGTDGRTSALGFGKEMDIRSLRTSIFFLSSARIGLVHELEYESLGRQADNVWLLTILSHGLIWCTQSRFVT